MYIVLINLKLDMCPYTVLNPYAPASCRYIYIAQCYRICNNIRNNTGATCGAGSAFPSGALRSPQVFGGVRVA